MVGIVEETGKDVTKVKPGDRVTVNVETFLRNLFFLSKRICKQLYRSKRRLGLGCRIDGGQAEYVCVPYADQGLNKIPDEVSDEQALFVGDVLATGLLGSQNIRNYRRRHRADHWRRPHRHLYPAVRDVKEAGKDSAL